MMPAKILAGIVEPAGAEARSFCQVFAARLKSCPDTKPPR